VRGLNRDKFIHVGRFSSSENFVCERGACNLCVHQFSASVDISE